MSHFLAIYAANWSDWWPQLAAGAFYSLLLTAAAFSLALLLGLMLALARRSKMVSHRGSDHSPADDDDICAHGFRSAPTPGRCN